MESQQKITGKLFKVEAKENVAPQGFEIYVTGTSAFPAISSDPQPAVCGVTLAGSCDNRGRRNKKIF